MIIQPDASSDHLEVHGHGHRSSPSAPQSSSDASSSSASLATHRWMLSSRSDDDNSLSSSISTLTSPMAHMHIDASPIPPSTGTAPSVTPKRAGTQEPPVLTKTISEPEAQWRLSPETIRLEHCSCNRPKKKYTLVTSHDYLRFTLDRLDKVWLRIAHLKLFPEVKEAAERVIRQMRERGLELFHLAAKDRSDNSLKTVNRRREISILFLVSHPDDDVFAHRIVAELLVHLRPRSHAKSRNTPRGVQMEGNQITGRKDSLAVENIATRFSEDWDDWTLSHPHTYMRQLTEAGVLELNIPDKKEGVSWSMIIDNLMIETQKLMNGYWVDRKEFMRFLTRVSAELRADGKRVCGFQLEKVYRQKQIQDKDVGNDEAITDTITSTSTSTSSEAAGPEARNRLITIPCVRIALKILGQPDTISSSPGNTDRSLHDIGAVVLLDLTDVDSKGRVNNLCVIYEGEWPMSHQYRTVIPPPTLEGVQRLVKE
ncbi:hypothetical protein IAU59_000161 [Kwoniella sp. CBS 9459]